MHYCSEQSLVKRENTTSGNILQEKLKSARHVTHDDVSRIWLDPRFGFKDFSLMISW
jgi:hypothetical protein